MEKHKCYIFALCDIHGNFDQLSVLLESEIIVMGLKHEEVNVCEYVSDGQNAELYYLECIEIQAKGMIDFTLKK